MRRWMVSMCLGLAVCCVPAAAQESSSGKSGGGLPQLEPAQPPSGPGKGEPQAKEKAASSLDDLLAQALKNNPDIRVAEAKVREAEAEAYRVRLLVTQKVVAIKSAIDVQKGTADQAEARFHTQKKLLGGSAGGGSTSKEEYEGAQQKMVQAKAKLSEIEAELAFLTGKHSQTKGGSAIQPSFEYSLNLQNANRVPLNVGVDLGFANTLDFSRSMVLQPHVVPPTPAAPGSATDKLRKALDTHVEVKFDDVALHTVLEFLQDAADISFRILDPNDRERQVNLNLKGHVSIGAVLQALEDSFSEGGSALRFVVRDYGILVTWADRVPPGALRVESLWKAIPTSVPEKDADAEKAKKQPAGDKPK